MKTKIVIAGGSGLIGSAFIKYLNPDAYELVILSRKHHKDYRNVRFAKWDGKTIGSWAEELAGADLLINLAGRSVNCRYNQKNKTEIYDSRLESTYVLGKALRLSHNAPTCWINMSTATIYRHEEQRQNTEKNGIPGKGFSVDVAKKWEKCFFQYSQKNCRKICIRTAVVLSKEASAFSIYDKHAKYFIGGKHGSGRQWISWIHEEDLVHAVIFLYEHNQSGIFNLASPNAVQDQYFMQKLRKANGVNFGIPFPRWALNIGAKIIGTEAELVLKSRWVYPERLLEAGFNFLYNDIDHAIAYLKAKFTKNKNTKKQFSVHRYDYI